jgi:glutamine---fructose-6-phosphate transaminase (isomerizing)
MCGIFGYVGKNNAKEIILKALKFLEYRGYDSSGIVLQSKEKVICKKYSGKLTVLEENTRTIKIKAHSGIGHVRWATHGEPSNVNAHPHFSCDSKIFIAHNGIIENYAELKIELLNKHKFTSQTDSEVIAHLLEENYKGEPIECILKTIKLLKGSYALCILFKDKPSQLYGVKFYSPLVLGVGKEEYFLASDIPTISNFTDKVYPLNNGEIVAIRNTKAELFDFDGISKNFTLEKITLKQEVASKESYSYYMEKEIFEEPQAIRNFKSGLKITNGSYTFIDNLELDSYLRDSKKVIITACGTAFYAGLYLSYLLDKYVGVFTSPVLASEFIYYPKKIERDTLVIAISQSGETKDTISAVEIAKEKGCKTLSICNVMASSLTKISDATIYIRAGIEIGVAATKTFINQLIASFALANYWANLKYNRFLLNIDTLNELATKAQNILDNYQLIKQWARSLYKKWHFFYLGRGICYPTALEGALKLKEIAYVHAEGYASGEMKHGPLALVNEELPVFGIICSDELFEKAYSNLKEITTRKGMLYVITDKMLDLTPPQNQFIVPKINSLLFPILAVIPLQLFALEVAKCRGTEIDKPRNLAKSVTVE